MDAILTAHLLPLADLQTNPWLAWSTLLTAPTAFVAICVLQYINDRRYERRDEAEARAKRFTQEHGEVVKRLETADAENKRAIEKLSDATKSQHEAISASLQTFRGEVNVGFLGINRTVTDGILKISTEVAEMRGRLSGAAGVHPPGEQQNGR